MPSGFRGWPRGHLWPALPLTAAVVGHARRRLAAWKRILLALGAAGCGGDAGPSRFVSPGTAGTGDISDPFGDAIASLMSPADWTRQYNAEVTGGSLNNVMRLRDSEIESA